MKPTPPAAAAVTPPKGARRFWLDLGGRALELRIGVLQIGRSSGCHISLDDPLISRRHAQLIVELDKVTIQDSGSVNGVYVNGRRISGSEKLNEGDQIQIGTQVMILRSAPDSGRSSGGARVPGDTLRDLEAPTAVSPRPFPPALTETEATFSAHTLDLLGGVAEKVLALGRAEEAEKVLATTLTNLLNDVRARGGSGNLQTFEKAAQYALKLAEVTGKGRWLDYAIELYVGLHRPLPPPVVDQLYLVLRKVDAVSLPLLRAYIAELRGMQQSFGPSERFVLQRLDGFERLASLK